VVLTKVFYFRYVKTQAPLFSTIFQSLVSLDSMTFTFPSILSSAMCFFHISHPLNHVKFHMETKPYFGSYFTSSWADLGSDLNMFPTKPSKTIIPPSKLEGNAAHRVHNTVSSKIDFMGDYNTQAFSI
jgi:hypothetical protein